MMDYTLTYYLRKLDAAGIDTDGTRRAAEIHSRPLPLGAAPGTRALAAQLAAGEIDGDEMAARLGPILARQSKLYGAVVQQAQEIRKAEARQALADDAPALEKALRAREKAVRDAADSAGMALRGRGIFTQEEALQFPDAAALWSERSAARRRLGELRELRAELVAAGILPQPAPPKFVERVKKAAGIT